MTGHEQFLERVVHVDRPVRHYTLLRSPTGAYLGTADGRTLGTLARADDAAIWQRSEAGFEHVATGLTVESDSADSVCVPIADQGEQAIRFVPVHGPAHLPSDYLRDFRANGWVCLACILSTDIVEGLQRASCSGPWSDQPPPSRRLPLTQDIAIARAAAEPVSLWLMRQYLQTDAGLALGLSVLVGNQRPRGRRPDSPGSVGRGGDGDSAQRLHHGLQQRERSDLLQTGFACGQHRPAGGLGQGERVFAGGLSR